MDGVLPVDNILQPRRIYNGDENQMPFQEQHRGFVRIGESLSNVKKKQLEYVENQSKKISNKNHRKRNKLDKR